MDNEEIVDISMNLYDKVTRYSHCVVEILENTITGEMSIGWYPTEETEELREHC